MTRHRCVVRLFVVLTFLTASTYALADEGGCKLVVDAMAKQAVTPYHAYQSSTVAGSPGKPRESESINTPTMHYLKVDGKWTSRLKVNRIQPLVVPMRKWRRRPDSRANASFWNVSNTNGAGLSAHNRAVSQWSLRINL
jgi:hypothetical protein